MKRVLVAMSGGVDSSVAAAVLVDQGYEVIGATMQVWDYSSCDIEEGHGTCCSSTDVDDARAVADKLNIPFYVINCESKFKVEVIDPFIHSYLEGKTPLPCVNCNTYLKFDHLLDKMRELECDYLATGHYAKIEYNEKNETILSSSDDSWKDQTYFLFTTRREDLKSILFPIGHMEKSEVRKLAHKKGLLNASKKDSIGICFVGNKGYGKFIEENVAADLLNEGEVKLYPTGEVLGRHKGIHNYTYGQRRGLGLSHHQRLFVIKVNAQDNTVWLGEEKYLMARRMRIKDVNWLDEIRDGETLNVKIRYQHGGAEATVRRDTSNDEYLVEFSEDQRAITPGQAAVVYRGSQLVGGGWITDAL